MADNLNITSCLEAAIKVEGFRQTAIANNIANIDTPGYKRIAVKFEECLSKALEAGDEFDIGKIKTELYQPRTTPLKGNGNDVDIDTETSEMVQNTLKHKALTRLLKKKYMQIAAAIKMSD